MSGSTDRGRGSGIRLTIRDTIHNGSVVDKCVCGDNVGVGE